MKEPPIPGAYDDVIKELTPISADYLSTGPISLGVSPGRGAAKISPDLVIHL
jgi:hypothetical protein